MGESGPGDPTLERFRDAHRVQRLAVLAGEHAPGIRPRFTPGQAFLELALAVLTEDRHRLGIEGHDAAAAALWFLVDHVVAGEHSCTVDADPASGEVDVPPKAREARARCGPRRGQQPRDRGPVGRGVLALGEHELFG
jgi:hypothetical protein